MPCLKKEQRYLLSMALEQRIDKEIEIAIELLNAVLDIRFISRITDLSIEEIQELPRYGYSNQYEEE